MTFPFLPKLRDDHQVPSIPRPGSWERHPTAVLEQIGNGLDTAVDPDYFDVDSIPDIWARPLLFEMALYDESHPIHEKILGEWRGLASLIALSDWKDYSLEIKSVDLSRSSAEFAGIAEEHAPERSIAPDTTWTELQVIYCYGKPVGITSPTTLFATAVRYEARGVEWFNGRFLCDPMRKRVQPGKVEDVLNDREKNAVAHWLKELRQDIQSHPGPKQNSKTWDSLLGVIHDFEDDLGGVQSRLRTKRDAFNVTTSDIFRYLDNVPRPPAPSLDASDVQLVGTRAGDENRNEILMIDSEIARQWQVDPNQVTVYGIKTLSDVRHEEGGRGQLDGSNLPGAEWRRAEDFFTDHLYVVRGSEVFNPESVQHVKGQTKVKDADALPPVKPELLKYFEAEDLAERIEIMGRGEGTYSVRLTLPLSGRDGRSDVHLEREYEKAEIVYLDGIPILEVWPGFASDTETRYYGFFDGERSFYVDPIPEPVDRREKEMQHGEIGQSHYEMDRFPEAFRCYGAESQEVAGLLLLKEPETVSSTGDTWRVGVDFGTTNTTVYVNRGDGPEPVSFADRLRPITLPPDQTRLTGVNGWFLPPCEQKTPFPTLYQDLHDQKSGAGSAPKALLDGHIFYVNEVSYSGYKQNELNTEEIYSDLKWSDNPEDRKLIESFLDQLARQIRVEARAHKVSDIEWSYSVPTSFSESQRSSIRRIWNKIIDDSAQEKTESLSTAAYFLDAQEAPMATGAICIDIGGASADIAIWQNYEMRLQTSVLLAGREILTKAIQAAPEKFADIFGETPSKNTAVLEATLVREEEKLLDNLVSYGGTEAVQELRQHIALGVSCILYYVGLLIRYLIDRDRFQPDGGLPDLYLGGNGAKMLHWLENGQFDDRGAFGDLFERVLTKATGLEEGQLGIQIAPMEKMKHEVAYGLVADRNLADDEPETIVIAGDAGKKNGQTISWDQKLSAEDYRDGLNVGRELGELRTLVSLVNDFADNSEVGLAPLTSGDVDRLLSREVVDRVRNHLRENHLRETEGEKEEHIDVEPLFMIAAREFLGATRAD